MPILHYATTNPGKIASLREHLEPAGFEIVQANLVIPEPRFDRVEDRALYKIMFAYQETRQPTVANDAGFFVRGLNGFPGSFVNFSLKTVKIEGLLRLADLTDRVCKFRHALAFSDGRSAPQVFCDEVPGTMASSARGTYDPSYHWSELVRIFIPDGQTKTLGEMDRDEYTHWSKYLAPKPRYADQFLDWYRTERTS